MTTTKHVITQPIRIELDTFAVYACECSCGQHLPVGRTPDEATAAAFGHADDVVRLKRS